MWVAYFHPMIAVNEIELFSRHITRIIRLSGLKTDEVCRQSGISKKEFEAKRKAGNFTMREIQKIIRIVDTEELEDRMLLNAMEEGRKTKCFNAKETRKYFDSFR